MSIDKPQISKEVIEKAKKIKFVLTDSDGVLTDTGVYYSESGEAMKRFSIRDGMGVERLKRLTGISTGIITGENSEAVKRRAEKLDIFDLYLYCKDKAAELKKILLEKKLDSHEIAYIGDDVNDLEIISKAGLSACPNDAVIEVKEVVDFICENKGGNGAFREFAELIISAKIG
ncbi:MAG: KdsC family phosphatase [Bacillota bacterium]